MFGNFATVLANVHRQMDRWTDNTWTLQIIEPSQNFIPGI